jgi:hypothetical protein
MVYICIHAGADPEFQVKGTLKKLRRAEEGANILGVFRACIHIYTIEFVFITLTVI